MEKIKVIERLIDNRLRFDSYGYFEGLWLFELDPNELCGLEVGDVIENEDYSYNIVKLDSRITLIVYRK